MYIYISGLTRPPGAMRTENAKDDVAQMWKKVCEQFSVFCRHHHIRN